VGGLFAQDTAREVERWLTHARVALGLETASVDLPRQPGYLRVPCPYCHGRLKWAAEREIVFCSNPRCKDSEGRKTVARIRRGHFSGENSVVFGDGFTLPPSQQKETPMPRPHSKLAVDTVRLFVAEMYEEQAAGEPVDVLAHEQESLWHDLDEARRYAIRGGWSIACERITGRIVRLVRETGVATHWGKIQISLLEDFVYQAILDELAVAYEPPDMDRVAELRAQRDRQKLAAAKEAAR
jgi:hypothetical protein